MLQTMTKDFCFLKRYIWVDCVNLSLLWRECLSSAVNVWLNSPKISAGTDRDIFQLNIAQSDKRIW